jgi:hypothetical protein
MELATSDQMTPIQAKSEPRARRGACAAAAIATLGLSVVASACSLYGSGEPTVAPEQLTRAERIQALRHAIAGDHENLEDLITQPREDRTTDPHLDPETRTIANRLGENERELARLEALALEDAR